MSRSKPYHVELKANKSAYIYLFNTEVYYVPSYQGEHFRDKFGYKKWDKGLFDVAEKDQLMMQEYIQNKGPLYYRANFLNAEFLILDKLITLEEFENLKVLRILKQ